MVAEGRTDCVRTATAAETKLARAVPALQATSGYAVAIDPDGLELLEEDFSSEIETTDAVSAMESGPDPLLEGSEPSPNSEAAPADEDATQPRLIELAEEQGDGSLLEGAEGLEISSEPLDDTLGFAAEQPRPNEEPLFSVRESLFGDANEDLADSGDEPEI